jgi:hypothetical protein
MLWREPSFFGSFWAVREDIIYKTGQREIWAWITTIGNTYLQLSTIFGGGTASPQSVNERSAEVVYTAISEAQACSASMDLVPRPSGGKPGISYIVKQIASIGKNIISGSTSIYYVCKVKISASYKSEITMALKGI